MEFIRTIEGCRVYKSSSMLIAMEFVRMFDGYGTLDENTGLLYVYI